MYFHVCVRVCFRESKTDGMPAPVSDLNALIQISDSFLLSWTLLEARGNELSVWHACLQLKYYVCMCEWRSSQ